MFSNPESNIEQFGLHEGDHVADLGAGAGFYTIAAAKRVGSEGKVFAIEVQKDLLDRINQEAAKQGITNISVVWGNIEKTGGTRIRDNSVGSVILANVLFQVADKPGTLAEVSRILESKGKVLFIDWSDSYGGMGPQADKIIKPDAALQLFVDAGFTHAENISAGEHHYGMVFAKN